MRPCVGKFGLDPQGPTASFIVNRLQPNFYLFLLTADEHYERSSQFHYIYCKFNSVISTFEQLFNIVFLSLDNNLWGPSVCTLNL